MRWISWLKDGRWWPPSPFVWLILSALLFLVGATNFGQLGSHLLAEIGVLGAVAAIAVVVAFMG